MKAAGDYIHSKGTINDQVARLAIMCDALAGYARPGPSTIRT